MSQLSEYVDQHTIRGACQCGKCIDGPENPEQNQPDALHTANLIFFEVAIQNSPEKNKLIELVKNHVSEFNSIDLFDGKEHSFLEIGGFIGDQGLALQLMGLGSLLGIWGLLTPETIMPFLSDEIKKQMAGQGFITIKAS